MSEKCGADLLDMTLRDILEEYCILFSPECMHYYGIAKIEDTQKAYDDYLENVSDHPSFSATPVIGIDVEFECLKILSLADIEYLLENHLGFSKNEGSE